MLPEQIKTIKNNRQNSFKEKGSEFIAIAYPVDNETAAQNHLQEIRKKYYDATHHCYAYKIKTGEQKYSDDGEPNGTAGIRILNAIEHFDLTDILLIVVRYFGGVKLGVGPLGKAYYNASTSVLEHSEIVQKTLYEEIGVEVEFNFISNIHRVANQLSAIISDMQFTTNAYFTCYIKPINIEKFIAELTNLTNGQISIKRKKSYRYLV
ncbi:MAG TPA: YigZ family protein [Ignavibacteriaceae bacterium]|nr:YigZ family protein [Ignavibacteriaceae bacterium]